MRDKKGPAHNSKATRKKKFTGSMHLDAINGTGVGEDLHLVDKDKHNFSIDKAPSLDPNQLSYVDPNDSGGGGGGITPVQPAVQEGPATFSEIDGYDCPTLQGKIADWKYTLQSARLSADGAKAYNDCINYAQARYDSSCATTIAPAPVPQPQPQNNSPKAIAGNAQTIQLPNNTAILDGSNSFDQEQTPITFSWTLVDGPNIPSMVGGNKAVASVSNLVEGQYSFRLTVMDAGGASDHSTVNVTVSPAAAIPVTQPAPPVDNNNGNGDNNNNPVSATPIQVTAPTLTQQGGPYATSTSGNATAPVAAPVSKKVFPWLILYAAAATAYIVFSKNE